MVALLLGDDGEQIGRVGAAGQRGVEAHPLEGAQQTAVLVVGVGLKHRGVLAQRAGIRRVDVELKHGAIRRISRFGQAQIGLIREQAGLRRVPRGRLLSQALHVVGGMDFEQERPARLERGVGLGDDALGVGRVKRR